MVPVGACLGLSAVLFGIGLIGFLSRRNIILMLVSFLYQRYLANAKPQAHHA